MDASYWILAHKANLETNPRPSRGLPQVTKMKWTLHLREDWSRIAWYQYDLYLDHFTPAWKKSRYFQTFKKDIETGHLFILFNFLSHLQTFKTQQVHVIYSNKNKPRKDLTWIQVYESIFWWSVNSNTKKQHPRKKCKKIHPYMLQYFTIMWTVLYCPQNSSV